MAVNSGMTVLYVIPSKRLRKVSAPVSRGVLTEESNSKDKQQALHTLWECRCKPKDRGNERAQRQDSIWMGVERKARSRSLCMKKEVWLLDTYV